MMKINRHYTKLLSSILLSLFIIFAYSTIHNRIIQSHTLPTQSELLHQHIDLQRITLSDNYIVTDLQLFKCRRYQTQVNCDKDIPPGFVKLTPPLNRHIEEEKWIYDFDYYLIVKMSKFEETTRYIADISLEARPGYEVVESKGMGKAKTKGGKKNNNNDDNDDGGSNEIYRFYKKMAITNTENPIKQDQPVVRAVDILFGSNDLVDSRQFHQTLHLSKKERIHPILSVAKLSNADVIDLIKEQKEKEEAQSDSAGQQLYTDQTKFKIMQLSDLHFGQDLGKCNSLGEDCKSSDLKTLKFVEASLKQEQPDIVVITGDLFDPKRSLDYKSVILKSLQPIFAAKVKFVYTFGDEIVDAEEKESILEFFASLPGCLNTVPKDDVKRTVSGLTNYDFKITNEQEYGQSVELTVLDSQNKQIDNTQINYLYRLKNYHHEESSDGVPPAYKLMFFHYPIPQFRPVGVFKIIGTYNEKHPLETNTNTKFHDDILNCGYHVVSVGHEHENDACILSEVPKKSGQGLVAGEDNDPGKSIWLCYNAITGDSGTTMLDERYVRKLRLFEVDFKAKRVLSWKRKEDDKSPFDYQLIYEIKDDEPLFVDDQNTPEAEQNSENTDNTEGSKDVEEIPKNVDDKSQNEVNNDNAGQVSDQVSDQGEQENEEKNVEETNDQNNAIAADGATKKNKQIKPKKQNVDDRNIVKDITLFTGAKKI